MDKTFRKHLNSAIYMYGSKVVLMVVLFLVLIKVTAHLGPERFGVYATVVALVSFFSILASGSAIDDVLIADISSVAIEAEETKARINSAVFLRLVLGLFSYLALIIVVLLSYYDKTIFWLVVLHGSAMLFSFNRNNSPFIANYIVEGRRRTPEIVTLVVSLTVLFAKYIFADLGLPLFWFVFSDWLLIVLVSLALLKLGSYHKGLHISLSAFRWDLARSLFSRSLPLAVSAFFVIIYMRIDQIMLGRMVGMEAVGNYSIAASLVEAFNFIPAIAASLLLPIYTRHRGTDRMPILLAISFRAAAWCALLIVSVFTLYSEDILTFIWGNQYIASVVPLKILSWSIFFAFVAILHGPAIISHGYQKYVIYFCIGTAVLNILLNLLLIPTMGATGAAIATTASYGAGFFFIWTVPNWRFIAIPTWKEAMPLTVPVLFVTVKWPGMSPLPQSLILGTLVLFTVFLVLITFRQGKSLFESAEVRS